LTDTPDTDEAKLPDAAAADEWDIGLTSPPVEQQPVDALAAVTSPEKKKKPRIRAHGTLLPSLYCSARVSHILFLRAKAATAFSAS